MKKLLATTVALGAFALCVPTQAAPTTVYTTTEDFSNGGTGGWSGNTAAPSTAWDYDGSTINGAANASPGGAGTAGSLAITPTGGNLGWTLLNEMYVGGFDSAKLAFDPGYSAGNFPAASGTFTIVYTMPDNAGGGGGTYFQLMAGFNAGGGIPWALNGSTSDVLLGTIGGLEAHQATFSYTIPAASAVGYFNLMLGANTDFAPIETFYIDNIVVNANPVPEPATMSLLGLGAVALLLVRRSNRG